MSAKFTEIITDETKVPDTPSTKTFKTRVYVNIGQKWSTPENEFGGVLDTGFTGGALCSKRWLKAYENFMMKTHKSKPFVREPASRQTFIFGNDQERWSDIEVSLPVWVVNKWKYFRCRVIPGNLELLIGNKVITELDMAIRMATDTIRLGQGRWTKIPRSQSGHMILPLAPKGKECAPKKDSRRLRLKARLARASSNPGTGQTCPQTKNVDETLLKRTNTCINVVSERPGSCSNPTCSRISNEAGVNLKSATTSKNASDQGLGIRVPERRPSESQSAVACSTGRDLSMDEGFFTSSNVEQIGLYDKISKRFEDLCNNMNKKLETVLNTFTKYRFVE